MTSAKKWSNLQKFNSWNEIEQYLDVSNFKYLSKVQINELPRTQNTKLPSAKWPFLYKVKVEKILKGSLDSIPSPSPSVKIQFMVGIAGHCQQTFGNKKFVYITQQCFALLPQVNFPDNNLNFHWRWRWWDQIQAIFLNFFYFIQKCMLKLLQNNNDQTGNYKVCQYSWPLTTEPSRYFITISISPVHAFTR